MQFTLDPTTQSLSDVLAKINSSTRRRHRVVQRDNVIANHARRIIRRARKAFCLARHGDTSNFLTASATDHRLGRDDRGRHASIVDVHQLDRACIRSTARPTISRTAIPGIDLTISSSSPAGPLSTYYSVTVSSDPSQAETAIGAFVKAYNAAIQELNKDTGRADGRRRHRFDDEQ